MKDKLISQIKEYNRLYRLGVPAISDSEYDALVSQLRQMDPTNSWLNQIEPAPMASSRKRKLPIPMKSLNKVKNLGELTQWVKSLALQDTTKIVITPKYDGVSWLHNEHRGDTYSRGGAENEGQDCTQHFNIGKFPEANIRGKFLNSLTYGELVFKKTDWEKYFQGKINPLSGAPYKSPRNTIAGFINRDEAPIEIGYASFIRYGVDPSSLKEYHSFSELLLALSDEFEQTYWNQGHAYELMYPATVGELDETMLRTIFLEWSQYYFIDGLVIYIDDISLWEAIGRHQTSGNPLYAVAYKHPDFTEAFETVVKDINWKPSKSGALKPVVNIDAVDTGDCTMENPTGYNARFIAANHIGVGAKILVTRSGGVIPKILGTISPTYSDLPVSCPACGSYVEYKEPEIYCSNPCCRGVKLAKIIFFFLTVGAENVGEETFSKLFNAGYTTIKAILDLNFGQILNIEGFGEVIAYIILENNRKIKEGVDLATLMHASDCFKGIGSIKAQKLLDEMDKQDLRAFCEGSWLPAAPETASEIFSKLPITLQKLHLGYKSFMEFLDETGIPYLLREKLQVTGDRYSGLNICFSGVRDKELEQAIESEGGKIASGVSKNTTHLVIQDLNSTSGKISKAKQLGIPIITIEQCKNL